MARSWHISSKPADLAAVDGPTCRRMLRRTSAGTASACVVVAILSVVILEGLPAAPAVAAAVETTTLSTVDTSSHAQHGGEQMRTGEQGRGRELASKKPSNKSPGKSPSKGSPAGGSPSPSTDKQPSNKPGSKKSPPPQGPVGASKKPKDVCDLTAGRWVQDATLPAYRGRDCPFIPDRLNCDMAFRPDSAYQRLRWQPNACSLSRFDPQQFLTRMRGKVMAFAGDEIATEAMYASIRCQISAIATTMDWTGMLQLKNATGYRVPSFQFTAILIKAPFLTWALPANPLETGVKARWNVFSDWIVKKFVNLLPRSDVALISSGLWWNPPGINTRQYYKGGKFNSNQNATVNYGLAVSALEKFFSVPQLFTNWFGAPYLIGYLPRHNTAAFREPFTTCEFVSQPLSADQELYAAANSGDMAWNSVAKDAVGKNLRFLDVFRMSNYRADAHPGNYGFSGLDCTTWCLPGLPDAWVDVFYTQLLRDSFQ